MYSSTYRDPRCSLWSMRCALLASCIVASTVQASPLGLPSSHFPNTIRVTVKPLKKLRTSASVAEKGMPRMMMVRSLIEGSGAVAFGVVGLRGAEELPLLLHGRIEVRLKRWGEREGWRYRVNE